MEPFLSPAQTIADLRNAAAVLTDSAWGQGQDYNKSTGTICAFGAVRLAVGGMVIDPGSPCGFRSMDVLALFPLHSEEQNEALRRRDRAANVGRAFYRVMGKDIVTYNDDEGRSQFEVIRAMQTVADALEKDPRRA